jgi:hypothetical protein
MGLHPSLLSWAIANGESLVRDKFLPFFGAKPLEPPPQSRFARTAVGLRHSLALPSARHSPL